MLAVAATNLSHDSSAYGQFLDSPFDGATVVLEENAQPYIAVPQVQSSPFANPWSIVLLPDRIIYRSYLAGSKESRLGTQSFHRNGDGKLWDSTLGGRFGLLRIGPRDQPLGFQIDVEGAAHVRLDPDDEVDVRSADFRAGVPFAYGWNNQQVKFAYYHISSHVGDEFLLKNPGFTRLNYARDVLVLGYSIYPTERLRFYGEAGWAFWSDVSGLWEFQFGFEYAPTRPTGLHGEPFLAVNGHLREELNFGGGLTAQAGWAWRGDSPAGRLFRIGVHYYNGESPQFSFFDDFEHQIGLGMWYDF
ncbi:MAG: DUF1207 domain-containing protein [Planctomycetaceae bacterium]|nr:DUF1207 domain-containing protein [Planctomycetales bacterium]MCB9921786.1 DUF1207 domain-containing protein [Planctomycetaceae bacterium]